MIVGARQGGLSISETLNAQRSLELAEKGAEKKLTTHYKMCMQMSISEHTTYQTSKWIGYSSRRCNKSKE